MIRGPLLSATAAAESKLLQARVKMQRKYLDQYMDLYEVDGKAIHMPSQLQGALLNVAEPSGGHA
jgi:hypothetical protein